MFLKREYWEKTLFKVYPVPKAQDILSKLIEGVKIGRQPPSESVVSSNWPSASKYYDQVNEIINNDLHEGRLAGPYSTPPFPAYIVSPLGAFPKRLSTKIRVIHDLSYPVNRSVNCKIEVSEFPLSYSSVEDAVKLCQALKGKDIHLAKLDLQDAFKHIMVHPDDVCMLGFSWSDREGHPSYYFSKVLNFGLATAPALFDIFASALEEFMRFEGTSAGLVRYVDDFLVVASNEADCARNLQLMLNTCEKAGFRVQPAKVTAPAKAVEFLGIIVDTETEELRISEERMEEIRSELVTWQPGRAVTKRKILSLIGKLVFASRVVLHGRAFIGRLIQLSKKARALHHRVKPGVQAMRDIDWWKACLRSHNGVRLFNVVWTEESTHHIYTDSSDYGMGAFNHGQWFSISFTGKWDACKSRSINWRELLAAVKALATWGPSLTGQNVVFHIDNTSICYILNKLYSPSPDLMELVRSWCLYLEIFRINVAPVYISTHANVDADDLSRGRIREMSDRNPQADTCMTWPAAIKFYDSEL